MTTSRQSARARVLRLVAAAGRLADPRDPLGVEARAILPRATGLSAANVELALTTCLETHPTDAELDALVASVSPAPSAHVLLSANVFVAAHRAIALALAACPDVAVRPSRREPETTALLARAVPGLFRVVSELSPGPGDHVWAYGRDETLRDVADRLPPGVVLHAHGSGMGVVVVDARHTAETSAAPDAGDAALRAVAARLAADVVPFDQRGCLSPRLAIVLGSEQQARSFAHALAAALATVERTVPLGRLEPDEAEQVTRYRDTVRYAAELVPAGSGWVGLDVTRSSLLVPPPGRNVHVSRAGLDTMGSLRGKVACFASHGPASLGSILAALFPGARPSVIGAMQRPAFDGPVESR